MESTRQQKVSRLLLKEFSDMFQKESKHFAIGKLITVTSVRISPDLSVARIYLSIFPTNDSDKILDNLNKMNWQIRRDLGKRIRHQLRIVPEIKFFIDDSLDYIENIDNLLKK